MGTAFGLKLSHTRFASEISSKVAERVGYHVDVEYTIDELNKTNPSFAFTNVKTKKVALRTWVF